MTWRLLWRRFDSIAIFLRQFHFQDLLFHLKKSQFTYRKFSIVWLSRAKYLLLFCKAKPAWIKRSIHYVTAALEPRGATQRNSYLRRDFWYKGSKFWKWHCLRIMALEAKRLHQNSRSLCHLAGKRILYANNAHNFSILSLVFLKLLIIDRKCCIFLGHPVLVELLLW